MTDTHRHLAFAAASLILDKLTDGELEALNIAAQWNSDPRHVIGYEKARSLFTLRAADGTPLAHSLVKEAFTWTINDRLDNARKEREA